MDERALYLKQEKRRREKERLRARLDELERDPLYAPYVRPSWPNLQYVMHTLPFYLAAAVVGFTLSLLGVLIYAFPLGAALFAAGVISGIIVRVIWRSASVRAWVYHWLPVDRYVRH